MKVLITAPSLEENKNVSGIASVVRQIIKHGAAQFYHFQAGRQDGEKSNLRWIFKQASAVRDFRRTIRREKIDVVHINTALNPLSIVRDFVYAKAARKLKRPIVLHLHGGRFLAEDFQNKLLARIAEKMVNAANVVVVLSELEKRIVENRWKNLHVKVLENAVPIDEAQPRKAETNEKTIIFLGRLHESKGLNEIVAACRVLRTENFEFDFKCFGAGDLEDFFINKMSEILGAKFYYGGVIAGAEKWRQFAMSDIFLLPSRYGEGLPIAMLEAMAASCIVVASEMASIGAVIQNGVNGFMIEPRNVAQLIEVLKSLLSGEKDSKIIGENARQTVAAKFSMDEYIVKLEKIYGEIGGATN